MTPPAMHNMRWDSQLYQFLLETFDQAELSRWIHRHYLDLYRALPSPTLSQERFIFETSELLIRRGCIDGEFFAALAAERGRWARRVETLRALWEQSHQPTRSEDHIKFEGPHATPIMALEDFTGRDDHLVDLERLLLGDTTSCVTISGIGGIGKTTLVQQFVHNRAPQLFPDGVAWLDGRVLPAELARVARNLDPRVGAPNVEDAQEILRDRLGTRRYLLVIDGFAPDGDPSLIPVVGGSCRTIVTSSQAKLSHSLLGARSLPFGPWTPDQALAFLRKLTPSRTADSDDELRALAEFVGCLPLGVRLLALLLANRESTSATAILAELKRQPLTALEQFRRAYPGVTETFQSTWDTLDDQSRRVLQALTACAEPTRTATVTAVARVADPTAALDALIARSLVQHTSASPTPWSTHNVVRMFVEAQPGFEASAAAHVKWVEAYLNEHQGPLYAAAMTAGAAEAIQAFQRLLKVRDVQRAAAIYLPIMRFFRRVGRVRTAVELGESLLAICPSGSAAEGTCLHDLGVGYRRLGEVDKAIECHTRSLKIQERLGRLVAQADNLCGLASCYSSRGQHRKAIPIYRDGLAIYERHSNTHGVANTLGNLGLAWLNTGNLDAAFEHLTRALSMNRALKYIDAEEKNLSNLGIYYRRKGDLSQALELHRQALELSVKMASISGQAQELSNIAKCHGEAGDYALAIESLEQTRSLYKDMGNTVGRAQMLSNLAICYLETGEVTSAIACQSEALAVFQQRNLTHEEAACYGHLSRSQLRMKNIPKAIQYAQHSLALCKQRGFVDLEASQLGTLGLCSRTLGKFDEALRYYERALTICTDKHDVIGQANQIANLGLCYAAMGEPRAARERLEEALRRFRTTKLPDTNASVRTVLAALTKL